MPSPHSPLPRVLNCFEMKGIYLLEKEIEYIYWDKWKEWRYPYVWGSPETQTSWKKSWGLAWGMVIGDVFINQGKFWVQ